MFQAIILPIFRSTRLCFTACGIMHPRCCRPAISWVHYTTCCNTQSSAPENGRNNRPKHVELIGIINKPLLLHLVGCLYYLYQWCTVKQISNLWVGVCGLSYPASKAHPAYYTVICGLSWLYHILPHYLINGTIFGNKGYWTWNVFWFSLQFLSVTFLILRRISLKLPIFVRF